MPTDPQTDTLNDTQPDTETFGGRLKRRKSRKSRKPRKSRKSLKPRKLRKPRKSYRRR